ncbi:MAG: endonuclease/exonuclease/phosphatase family protein, partial [Candidatus Thiodiazotropha sp.]
MTNKKINSLNIVTYNCKNVNTSIQAIGCLSKMADIILLQEHWLYDCQLHKLNELNILYNGKGKAVDSSDPIPPIQMPRGYGGVGILWKKDIDHLVTVFPDGGERIQCLELKAEIPKLIISIYLPCKGATDNYAEFTDCIDQLNEVVLKYKETHEILIGGDFNEIYEPQICSSRRSKYLKEFLVEHMLVTQTTGKTFIHPNGTDSSTIDFFFYQDPLKYQISKIEVLRDLLENNSDHYPINCQLDVTIERAADISKDGDKPQKVKWNKIDKDLYVACVSQGLQQIHINSSSVCALDNAVIQFNEVLQKSAQIAAPPQVKRSRVPTLRVWTPEISSALSAKKHAFHLWKTNGRSQCCSNPYVTAKAEASKQFRKACRTEAAKQRFEARQEILNAHSDNMTLFHKLINKQRGRLSSFIDELHVSDKVYKAESGVLAGWYEHFKQLASIDKERFQCQNYHKLVEQEFPEIEDLCRWDCQYLNPITHEELLIAISKLNSGKAADINGITAEHFIYSDTVVIDMLQSVLNEILKKGMITDSMKIGLLTPVFKKKGNKTEAKNYRGITVIPVLTKILEL